MEAIFHTKSSSFFWLCAPVLCAVGYVGDLTSTHQLKIVYSNYQSDKYITKSIQQLYMLDYDLKIVLIKWKIYFWANMYIGRVFFFFFCILYKNILTFSFWANMFQKELSHRNDSKFDNSSWRGKNWLKQV